MPRSPVLPEGLAVDDLLELAVQRGGERYPGRYRVVELGVTRPRSCKGLLGAVRCAQKLLRSYSDFDEPPFRLVVGDQHFDDPYFEELLDEHPDARFVIGWSAMAPVQDLAVAVLALSTGSPRQAATRRSPSRARQAAARGTPTLFEAVAAVHDCPEKPKPALALIHKLVQRGADPHETRPEGNPLHALFDSGYDADEIDLDVLEAIVRVLLEYGVDEARNEEGCTPGDLALEWDYPGIHVCFSRFTAGGTATAAIHGRLDALRHLASLGVPLDEPNPHRRDYTPLHHAIEHGHAKVAAFLLERGADPARKTRGWKQPKRPPASARELAAKSKHAAIRALF